MAWTCSDSGTVSVTRVINTNKNIPPDYLAGTTHGRPPNHLLAPA